jgi:hypothetical protein
MPGELVPAELRDFLARHIDSIAQLEALLLSRGSPNTLWDAATAAKRLYIAEPEAAEILAHLAECGLLERAEAGYRYAPRPAQLAALIDLLADQYARHLIPITNLIHAKPRRIRQFADAFKLKKD